jgi:hypothetical protein
MKQKIEVRVTAAVDDRWPKVVGEKDKYPSGSMWYVYQGAEFLHLCRVDVDTTLDTKLGSLVPFASKICFPDFETLADWWTNPQPVKTGTLYCTFRSLDMGAIFLHESNVFIVSEPYANNQARGFGWAVCPEHGFATLFYPDTDVVTFYGTITINVGRDAE